MTIYLMVSGMFGGLFGPKVCANCKKQITGKVEKYGGKSFCSTRCMDIYRHKDLNRHEK
ncbi:MAG TPA: hypothetical protein VMC84_04715 [Methanocella sp.]|uniref:hypothetical protein n=1 Tax=Methanocella sp. TaxID=2052833 RepID=UPI002B962734|nr:hypothetical protein [Methanocella sp.]HTY90459.1 hypothetical protein [Methanocella sp.]